MKELLHLRMLPELKEKLSILAEKEHRSLSNMIEFILLEYFKKEEVDRERD